MYDEPDTGTNSGEHQSYDAFWAEQLGEVEHETIRGVRVEVPRDMPLKLLRMIERNAAADANLDVVHEMAAALFSQAVLQQWVDAGMGIREFQVVIRWGTEHAKGRPVTWRQAYDQVAELESGKAQTRTRSGGTGSRSRRTSPANTTSTHKRSPA